MESNACFFLHYMPFLKAVGSRADARTVMGWWCGARTVLTSGVANFTQPYRGLSTTGPTGPVFSSLARDL